jgi:hypothetical protein
MVIHKKASNMNKITLIEKAEIKLTQCKIKTNGNSIMTETLPYFRAWSVNALKYYTNLLTGNFDREVVIQINNLYCYFEVSIEFFRGITLKRNIRNQLRFLLKL